MDYFSEMLANKDKEIESLRHQLNEFQRQVDELKKENETLYKDRNEAFKLWDDLKNEQTQDVCKQDDETQAQQGDSK